MMRCPICKKPVETLAEGLGHHECFIGVGASLPRAQGSPRTFPIQGQWHREQHKWVPDSTIPWALIAPHEKQALENHCDQSLATLARRGGCSHDEAVAIIEDRKWHAMDFQAAIDRLAELVREYEPNTKLSDEA